MGFFDKLKEGLQKTKSNFSNVFTPFRKVDEELLEELEETMIMSDIGTDTTMKIIDNLRNRIKKEKLQEVSEVKNALREEIQKVFDIESSQELNL